ncbi:hypothetical protein GCM10011519_21410 [Marmoricola endophyticus]|uniref:BD-FAE-like domain-containing protein n=1 Tax=Marmoricola endophyticus TaxID=2040280 RepID=A0A917BKA3_9ACTN|nr:alpha/beta hydrolase [Marmoricola endophyticus]GGF47106.1 hypothetical protein GCM10011519_21410 [Marmoricola endophyticus]
MTGLDRRSLLLGALATAAGIGLAGCGDDRPDVAGGRRTYGPGEDQYGDLLLPKKKKPVATVVTIHGGYWYDGYGLDLMNPIAGSLVDDGAVVWNLEYRRIGGGGGWPATFEDVAAGIDALPDLEGLPNGAMDSVVVLGHSAGGHLAVWAASRTARTPGGAPAYRLDGCLSLAGALDLTTGSQERIGQDAVNKLMGGTAEEYPERYDLGDPTRLVPASCPVVALRGVDDTTVPKTQSTAYVEADTAAGGKARFEEVPGDHFTLIEPKGESWKVATTQLAGLAGR